MTASLRPRIIALARAFAVGTPDVAALTVRGARAVGRPPHMVRPVAERFSATFEGRTRPRLREIVDFLLKDRSYQRRKPPAGVLPPMVPPLVWPLVWTTESARMRPVPSATTWNLPVIETLGALAEWLNVSNDELAWYADLWTNARRDIGARRHHYHYTLRTKAHGGLRLLEAPQARLKTLQRRILTGILNHVPPYHTAAHGFVRGRSVRSFAAEHAGRQVVLRLDLENFFPCIGGSRVQALFRTCGYPEAVADMLGGLCTTVTPSAVFSATRWPTIDAAQRAAARRLYARPHLPQGAPTSPALANLCAYRLDCRLTGLADWAGAVYSRYADDIAFSGNADVARHIARYVLQIASIAHDEGWLVQHRKTRVMRQGVQQRLAGVVVNAHVNVARADYDTLKALLTNCVRHGPTGQNRERHPDFRAHLTGRVAWVASLNPAKGRRLSEILQRIAWPGAET